MDDSIKKLLSLVRKIKRKHDLINKKVEQEIPYMMDSHFETVDYDGSLTVRDCIAMLKSYNKRNKNL